MRRTITVIFIFVAFLISSALSSCVHISTQVPVDSDNDRVFDNYDYRYDLHFITPQYYDKCPTSTPRGVKVDDWGCPWDSDKDGVPDYFDKCPETPTGVKVNKDGCPLDSDMDGVPDYLDKCPGTPAGVRVDQGGCPPVEKSQEVRAEPPVERNLRVALLPNQEGRAGVVIVKSSQGEVVLDQAYMAADVYSGNKIESKVLDAETVQKEFGQALSAQPQRPVSYTLFFTKGKDELTSESKLIMNKITVEMESRSFPQITIIGHADRVGSNIVNDSLSLKRAEAVRRILVESGFSASAIETAGRGSRELLVPTGEGVEEPRNRRVEINIR